jgi:hypothetical protein
MAFDYSTISDVRVAATIRGMVLRLLADRNQLPNHAVFRVGYAGDASETGSASLKIPHLGSDGYDAMTATGDGVTVGATDLSDGATTVTVARSSLRYDPTDLARFTGPRGQFDAPEFAQWMVRSAGLRLVDQVCALSSGFSTTVGTSGSDATVQNFLDGKRALNVANAEGELLAILHPTQWHDILDDLNNNAGGALQYEAAAQDLRNRLGNAYQGKLAGVDVWTSTRVPTANAGADRAGMMLAPGSIVWADARPRIDLPGQQTLIGKVLFEVDRQAAAGISRFIGHYYSGVAEGLDGAGVSFVTDA